MGEYDFHAPYWDAVSFEAKDFVAKLLVSVGSFCLLSMIDLYPLVSL